MRHLPKGNSVGATESLGRQSVRLYQTEAIFLSGNAAYTLAVLENAIELLPDLDVLSTVYSGLEQRLLRLDMHFLKIQSFEGLQKSPLRLSTC